MSLPPARSPLHRTGRVPAGFAAAGLLGAFFAHVAGGLGLAESVRIGALTVGTAALSVALRYLVSLSEGRNEGSFGGAAVVPFTRWLRSELSHRIRARRSAVVGPASLEFLVTLGERSAADFHARLRPRLRSVATGRLLLAGIDPNDRPAVTEAIGPLGAAVVGDAATRRPERNEPGVEATRVCDLLRRLDGLA